jgi:hypothetical protein
MIIDDFDFERFILMPFKAYPPSVIYSDFLVGVLPFPKLQAMVGDLQAKPGGQDVCYGTDVLFVVLPFCKRKESSPSYCFYCTAFCSYAAIRKPPAALVDAY